MADALPSPIQFVQRIAEALFPCANHLPVSEQGEAKGTRVVFGVPV